MQFRLTTRVILPRMSLFLAPNGHADCVAQCPLLWGQSGKHMLLVCFSVFDPTATLAVHCGAGFGAGFNPYQGSRLSG
jgi:hypothetical protein